MNSKFKLGCFATFTTSNGKHIVKVDSNNWMSNLILKDGNTWFRKKTISRPLPAHVTLFQNEYWKNPQITDCFVDEPFMVNGRIYTKINGTLREVDRNNIICTLPLCNNDIKILLTEPRQSFDLLQFCNEYVSLVKQKRANLNLEHFRKFNKIKYEPIIDVDSLKRFCSLTYTHLPFSDQMLDNALNVL